MPIITVKLTHLRVAPRKARLVADLIRGKGVVEAKTLLGFVVKKSAPSFLKLLNSATAAALKNQQLEESKLYVSKVLIDEGQKYKRWRPRARGQAKEIQKKTCHITLVLDENIEAEKRGTKRGKSRNPRKSAYKSA